MCDNLYDLHQNGCRQQFQYQQQCCHNTPSINGLSQRLHTACPAAQSPARFDDDTIGLKQKKIMVHLCDYIPYMH